MTRARPALPALSLLLCALLAGCGKAVFFPATPAAPTTITGNWYIAGQYQANPSSFVPIYMGGSLLDTGGQLSGVFHINSNCFGNYATDVPYTGMPDSNNHLSITSSSVNGQVLTLDGTLSSNASTLNNATFSIAGGCTGNLDSLTGSDGPGATFDPIVERIPNLTGSWTTAEIYTAPAAAEQLTIAEQLTQSTTADANGDFALTGTVTIQGSPCFTHGTLQPTSFISGYLGQQVILMNDGSNMKATLQATPGVDNSIPTLPSLVLEGAITGGNCSGPIDLSLQ